MGELTAYEVDKIEEGNQYATEEELKQIIAGVGLHYICPRHEDVEIEDITFITVDGKANPYCKRCFNQFLSKNLPVLELSRKD